MLVIRHKVLVEGRTQRAVARLTAMRLHQLLHAEGHQVGVTLVRDAVAEVDCFEVHIDVAGERRKAWLFLLRLMYSGRVFGWIYERQDQVSVLDGHVRAPIPSGPTLDTINGALLAQLDARDAVRRDGTRETIGARLVEEQRVLRPVDVAFVAEAATVASITPRGLARVHGAY